MFLIHIFKSAKLHATSPCRSIGTEREAANRTILRSGQIPAFLMLLVLAFPIFGACAQQPQAEIEESFRKKISAENIGRYIEILTAHPTYPGSPHSREYAEWTADHLRQWGWDTRVETWRVLFPKPVDRVVELLGPKPFKAKLFEPPIPGDSYSQQSVEHLPSYFIYGPDGDVTANANYAN